jgi:hypothetical protein
MTSRNGPPMRARKRIACINFERALPAFEEHEMVWGQYECLDCGGRHDVPVLGLSLVCPELSADEGKKRATGRIDALLARAKGQYQKVAESNCRSKSLIGRNITPVGARRFSVNVCAIPRLSHFSYGTRRSLTTVTTGASRRMRES